MSTTPEVIIARHMRLPCFAVSIITDLGVEGKIEYTTHESVQKEAAKTEVANDNHYDRDDFVLCKNFYLITVHTFFHFSVLPVSSNSVIKTI